MSPAVTMALLVLAIVASVAAAAIAPAQAHAWANGPYERNGFGTHDWVLYHALEIAGSKAAWVDRETALLATDDPDSHGYESAWHLFRDQGIGRGGPQRIADVYYLAVRAYQAGDTRGASKYLGELSHYYADILQPFHADYRALAYQSEPNNLHLDYELAVDRLTRAPEDSTAWIVARPIGPVGDVRRRAVSAGYYSRARFSRLLSALKTSTPVDSGDTNEVTREVMSRAACDLADIIASIPAGEGLSAPPSAMKTTMRRYYPARYQNACAYARCTDAAGRPIEGAGVRFTWQLATGSVSTVAYTDATGIAHDWQNTGASALMAHTRVITRAGSSGTAAVGSTWFMATPRLADGRAGIRTRLSDYTPKRYSTVTAATVCRDTAGRAVVGLPVTFTWKHRTKTITYRTVTDSRGIARHRRYIGGASRGYRVYVRAQTQSGGINRSSTASFVPE